MFLSQMRRHQTVFTLSKTQSRRSGLSLDHQLIIIKKKKISNNECGSHWIHLKKNGLKFEPLKDSTPSCPPFLCRSSPLHFGDEGKKKGRVDVCGEYYY